MPISQGLDSNEKLAAKILLSMVLAHRSHLNSVETLALQFATDLLCGTQESPNIETSIPKLANLLQVALLDYEISK
jgi:hypothetical protein